MLVSQILKGKSSQNIISIGPDDGILMAVNLLSKNRIGALVVFDDEGLLIGIVSERDIVREIGIKGTQVLNLLVRELMSKKVVTCNTNETAFDVLNKMTVGRFRHIPVMDNQKMVGLISIGDVVKARLGELDMEKQALEEYIGH
ncbi:MAG: CBS domain-containing protein [Rhodobacteraceae bacterium]|nr:CBS domain-containing protein [Paracoccaceae bacterium]MDE2760667.1 CBS domain-containing protein [Paracoccaceae bacterium]MDE2917324.1 CBS domain-containing protein [Paracoccaceae bacterium]MYE36561.1 CBS domain-containing protein [Paracoccaceae bacterium]MYG41974.1 CBS domain-containing protein [Paracoccaceae bacterium]